MLIPTRIKLNKSSQTLELGYADGQHFALPAEFLRVHSPSAEVQGHGNPILQHGKLNVAITQVQPAGNYALKLTFDDGHDTGLFTITRPQRISCTLNALSGPHLNLSADPRPVPSQLL